MTYKQSMAFQSLMISAGMMTGGAFASGSKPDAKQTLLELKPNIVLIYADDIGYGDFGCYGATQVQTPNIDRLAAKGLRFTDAHSVSSVCTPSRYSLLTGEYAFRKPNTGIASSEEGLLIDPASITLPSMLKRAGYATAIVGKWHLGLGTFPTDFNAELKPGPLEIGFDYAWIMPATGDRVPCVWVENHRVVNLDPSDPIKIDNKVLRGAPESFVNGIPRMGSQTGGKAALWDDEKLALVMAEKTCAFIEKHKNGRFFIQVSTHDSHVPLVTHPQFAGKSDCGLRGDTIVQFDWTVGQIAATLERLGLHENTLILITSDNGGVLEPNGPDKVRGGTKENNKGHLYNGILRGTKYTLYEGGTRVPFILSWPKCVQPGVSDALISQVDLLASFAALTGQKLEKADAPDSVNVLPALLGEKMIGRESLLTQVHVPERVALRKGLWKYIPNNTSYDQRGPELYNLADDLKETRNLAATHPEILSEMSAELAGIMKKQ
jgi:arylsulfatase A-like enzyme